ncbi:hypothetical protein HPB49_023340 [Dermacentor silvarum]|uniref:Uncharacterized protein n=1 Tax=Dermacentor silvarum TaxID=543639 RepID=A0ACB8E386_DERSI|nr:hypothetical protein HPB49_023340 [Dermacentor silvarum]
MGRCVLSMEVGGLPHGSTALGQRAPAEDVVFWRPFAPAAGLHGGADSCLDGSAADEAPRPPDACRRRPPVGLAPSPNSAFRPVRVKRLQCSYCGVSFLNNGELVGHLRVHTGTRAQMAR